MRKSAVKKNQEPEVEVKLEDLNEEQQFEVLCASVEAFCTAMQEKGADTHMLSVVLLEAFCARMAEDNDRDSYEELLQEAMETEWEDVIVH